MRASLHLQLPKLCADGTERKAKAVCKPLGLSVRGKVGESRQSVAEATLLTPPIRA
jgi:hypothetical protein